KPVDAEKLKAADDKNAFIAPEIEDLGVGADALAMRTKIAAGHDIVVSLKVGPSFKPVGKDGAKYIPNYEGGKGAQSLVLAGYATYPHGTYFLVHGSFGDGWGDKGYAWLHEATLKANLVRAFVVDTRPTDATKLKRKPPKSTDAKCLREQMPDA